MIEMIIPGTSVEVIAGERDADLGVVGVVTMPLSLDWGAQVTTIRRGQDTTAVLGHRLSEMKLLNECMNYANECIVYRLNTGTQAQGTLASGITAKAVYGGTRGNDITVTVKPSDSKFVIKTFLGTVEQDSQIVSGPDGFVPNGFISIEGSGTLAEATVKLENGTDGATEDYESYFAEIQKHEYNVMAYTGSDKETAQKIIDFIGEQRAAGAYVQCVVSGVAANNVAVYNSTVGGRTASYELTAAEACATMAGIIAQCGIAGSATNFDVTGWTDVSPKLTKLQQESKTQSGEILFVQRYGGTQVLYDINSLTIYTEQQPEDFHKGLVMRTLDKYATDLQKLLDTKAIGKIRNDINGRNEIKGLIAKMTTEEYLANRYIEGFTADDVTVETGKSRDSVKVTVGILVSDTVDKIYVTVIAE
jgi:phage tail sheath protein|nr:MAG TPA: tail sheath protein [Caudoviricetes sp.]